MTILKKIASFAITKSAKFATLKTTKIAALTLSCSNDGRLNGRLPHLSIQNWLISNNNSDQSDFVEFEIGFKVSRGIYVYRRCSL